MKETFKYRNSIFLPAPTFTVMNICILRGNNNSLARTPTGKYLEMNFSRFSTFEAFSCALVDFSVLNYRRGCYLRKIIDFNTEFGYLFCFWFFSDHHLLGNQNVAAGTKGFNKILTEERSYTSANVLR